MQIFSYLYDKALILKRSLILLEQYKYQNLIQKKNFSPIQADEGF